MKKFKEFVLLLEAKKTIGKDLITVKPSINNRFDITHSDFKYGNDDDTYSEPKTVDNGNYRKPNK